MHLGHDQEAVRLLEEALEVYRDLGNKAFVARTMGSLGYAALLRSDYQNAEKLFRQSLREFADLNEKMGIAEGLEGLAAVSAVTNRIEQAAHLAAAAGVIRELIAAQPLPLDQDTFQAYMQKAREHISLEGWTAAWEEGSKMNIDEAIALALG